jgi:hypothetical protein
LDQGIPRSTQNAGVIVEDDLDWHVLQQKIP